MTISPILESKGTLLDLFSNETARKLFEIELALRVMKAIGLPSSANPATHEPERVIINLSQLYLRQTPDTDETRLDLVSRATRMIRAKVEVQGIKELSVEGIAFESGYDVTVVGWHLVGRIWY